MKKVNEHPDAKLTNICLSVSKNFKSVMDEQAERFCISRSQLVYELVKKGIANGLMEEIYKERINNY